ncbi:CBF/Mak21 family-domain-containing protein [Dipodascopsis uninucleata]
MPSVVETRKRPRPLSQDGRLRKKVADFPPIARNIDAPAPTPEIIVQQEQQIISSTKNYNNLVYLLSYLDFKDSEIVLLAATSLFRSFVRLLASRLLRKLKSKSQAVDSAQKTLNLWLRQIYKNFKDKLVQLLDSDVQEIKISSLTIVMRLIKEEGIYMPSSGEYYFPKALFCRLVAKLCDQSSDDLILELVESYVNVYEDVRYYFFQSVGIIASEIREAPNGEVNDRFTSNALSALYNISKFPANDYSISQFLIELPGDEKHPLKRITSHRAAFQDAWLAVLRLPLKTNQYKLVLQVMHKKIIPNMSKPQMLMDFLTDSYDSGGSISLLALNGLFSLMQEYNLDYPNFYPKLYALLDRNIMHMKYRSRFFRMLDLFLSSSHLPALLIASFCKKLSRLSLSAPPSAIVIIVPFIYNLLKRHTTCNVLLQRIDVSSEDVALKYGMNDPYDNDASDPLITGALESSLWELISLQSHYHPNVATLAKILSEPFHKPSYNLEDFLDHSYSTMLDAEFNKNIRNPPPIEFDFGGEVFGLNENSQSYLPNVGI